MIKIWKVYLKIIDSELIHLIVAVAERTKAPDWKQDIYGCGLKLPAMPAIFNPRLQKGTLSQANSNL